MSAPIYRPAPFQPGPASPFQDFFWGNAYNPGPAIRSRMTGSFASTVKGFLTRPAETFRLTQADSLNSAYQYYVRLVLIYAVLLFALLAGAIAIAGSADPVTTGLAGGGGGSFLVALRPLLKSFVLFLPYILFMVLLFAVFLTSLGLHVFVILFGGQKGVVLTMKTVMYAATPSLLIGWIPIVNIAVAVWTYVLLVIGIRENQEMTTRRAILVVIAPLVLTLVLYAGIIVLIGDLARVYPLTGAGG